MEVEELVVELEAKVSTIVQVVGNDGIEEEEEEVVEGGDRKGLGG